MTVTIQPTIYCLTLTCGHTQLASRTLKVGTPYYCWTACDVTTPVLREVVSSAFYKPKNNEVFITQYGGNNSDMLNVQKVVDEANTR